MDRVKAEVPDAIFVSDMSSVLGARDLHKENLWDDYGVIFSGVHKNLGTSGLCVAIIRDDVMDRVISQHKRSKIPVPKLFDWKEYHKKNDFVNTPTLMAVYISQATCEYFNSMGGVSYYEDLAIAKANAIYKGIDDSKLFKCSVEPELRSS